MTENLNVMHELLHILSRGHSLAYDQAARAFQIIMNGGATPAQMAAFLMALKLKGETVDEISAGAAVMRAKAPKIKAPKGTIDTCGTGGDSKGSYNISTACAFVTAACGVPVAKHGNRAVSSHSGSADVLTALGVKVDAQIEVVQRCLDELGMCFMMAPKFHSAMRHVAPIRQELAMRTVFNLLGPLANPAQPDFQLLGVYSQAWLVPMAEVLKKLGVKRAWVVHGSDGMDELTLCGNSSVAALADGDIETFEVTPATAGLSAVAPESLKGGDPEYNAQAMREVLMGSPSPYKDAVMFNTAAALVVAEKVSNLKEGVELARHTLAEGLAYKLFSDLSAMTKLEGLRS